ncbi:MAG: flagellar hook-length control protein FliK, partial [Desulfovibrio sp.]|nr:flagellar hook-length control protein FliK [Desulfovibrio sp.]
MQILPTNATELLKAPAISTMLLDDERTNDFMDLINDILEDEDNEERSEDSQSQQVDTEALRAAPQVQSPYARNSHNGITFTLDEVCFTKQELQELRNDLIKAGATQESLSRLTALAELPDGATLAQVMASVKGTGATPLLSDDDKSGISSLLNQIDPSGVLNTTLQDLMQQGQGREA